MPVKDPLKDPFNRSHRNLSGLLYAFRDLEAIGLQRGVGGLRA